MQAKRPYTATGWTIVYSMPSGRIVMGKMYRTRRNARAAKGADSGEIIRVRITELSAKRK